MPSLHEVYKCEVCGNIIEVVHGNGFSLFCCGQVMTLMTENSVDAAKEKHVPVIECVAQGIKVKVGSVPHPMEEKHYIEWIDVVADDRTYRQHLKPGQVPEAFFPVTARVLTVREYCNLHGQWSIQL